MTDPIRTDLIVRLDARAVLDAARAALAEQQGEGPSHGDICQWLERHGHWGDNAHRIPRIANIVQDALARWGHPAPALNQVFAGPTTGTDVNAPHFRFLTADDLPKQPVEIERREAPPAEGEVVELVELLRKEADDDEIGDHMLWMTPADARRAAELLQQQAEIQKLWTWLLACEGTANARAGGSGKPKWPAHALPMPQGEVK